MFSAFQIFNISFISLTPYRQFKFKFSVYQLLSFTSGRTRAHMVSHLWWALVFITACDSFQISCNSDFSDSALVGDLVRHHFEFSADLSISFSELFIAQMEVDDADWILISNPCPKKSTSTQTNSKILSSSCCQFVTATFKRGQGGSQIRTADSLSSFAINEKFKGIDSCWRT